MRATLAARRGAQDVYLAYRRSYVDGLRSIGRWLATQPAGGTIVYTSSTGVYPQGGGSRVTEAASTDDASATGQVLREAEQELAAIWANATDRAVIAEAADALRA